MSENLDRPQHWKADIAMSEGMYNPWFINFAPKVFRAKRIIGHEPSSYHGPNGLMVG